MHSTWLPKPTYLPLGMLVTMLLTLTPMPDFSEVWRPLWFYLLISYWVVYVPGGMSLLLTMVLGLSLDVVQGSPIGQHALLFVLLNGFLCANQTRFKFIKTWLQCLILGGVWFFLQLIRAWLISLEGANPNTMLIISPVLSTLLLWPWMSHLKTWQLKENDSYKPWV